MSSSYYNDTSCPNNCMAENDYSSFGSSQACPVECLSGYANPNTTITCPSNCNYYEVYSTVSGMYDMYIPQSTKSRLLPAQSVVDNYQVQNDRITNFAGNVLNINETSNLATGNTTANVLNLVSQLNNANQQLIAAAKGAETSSKVAQAAASKTPVTLQNQGPASATADVRVATTAAQDASANAASAMNFATTVSNLADRILSLIPSLPATPEVQQAAQAAQASAAQAANLVGSANASAETAQNAAAASSGAIAQKTSGTEGFRFRRQANESKQKAALHNRLRYGANGFNAYAN